MSVQAGAQGPHQWKRSLFLPLAAETTVAERATLVDRDSAAALVRATTGGRVLGVRYASTNGSAVYQVKVLLPGGRVRIVRVNAQTGQLLD
jgi:uncharacterized membrane protein YkoI